MSGGYKLRKLELSARYCHGSFTIHLSNGFLPAARWKTVWNECQFSHRMACESFIKDVLPLYFYRAHFSGIIIYLNVVLITCCSAWSNVDCSHLLMLYYCITSMKNIYIWIYLFVTLRPLKRIVSFVFNGSPGLLFRRRFMQEPRDFHLCGVVCVRLYLWFSYWM